MFERFTEQARRSIFFARYEASSFGSPYIESEHLLLGLMREDKAIASRVPAQQIRSEIEERFLPREKISTSVDIPLSQESKTALAYGTEEADSLHHKHIDCGHLLLGLLRVEKCLAAELLRQHGIDYETGRAIVSRGPAARYTESAPELTSEPPLDSLECAEAAMTLEELDEPIAPSLQFVVGNFISLISRASEHLWALSDRDAEKPLAKQGWSRKEALGHLIDYATAHHHWFARALADRKLVAAGYPHDEWVRLQEYRSFVWRDLVQSWLSLNNLLAHVLVRVPEEKLNAPCRIGINDPVPLSKLISGYVEHCEDILGQILARG
jgi:hypothetical protein